MNQTRNFLLFALLAVAYLLFMAWENDHAPKPPATPAATASQAVPTSADASVPTALANASSAASAAVAGTIA
ncbi:MAG: membrane protein insertase YidC, partial [Rhodanobacter sp.]